MRLFLPLAQVINIFINFLGNRSCVFLVELFFVVMLPSYKLIPSRQLLLNGIQFLLIIDSYAFKVIGKHINALAKFVLDIATAASWSLL